MPTTAAHSSAAPTYVAPAWWQWIVATVFIVCSKFVVGGLRPEELRSISRLSTLLLAGTCAKQSYQAVVGSQQAAGQLCSGTLFKDHDGKWRCAEGLVQEPCSSSFSNTTEVMDGIGARCMQVCMAVEHQRCKARAAEPHVICRGLAQQTQAAKSKQHMGCMMPTSTLHMPDILLRSEDC
jgi:hypothetical protein